MNEYPLGRPKRLDIDLTEKPEWVPVQGKPWLEKNSKGQLRTALPEPQSIVDFLGSAFAQMVKTLQDE